MIKAYIVGPVLRPDSLGLFTPDMRETAGRKLSEIYAIQRAALKEAGIPDIDIVHRNRPDRTRLSIKPDAANLVCLFVRFDAVLDRELIYFMTRSRAESTILTASRMSHLTRLDRVEHGNGLLSGSGRRMAGKGDLKEEFYGVAMLRNPPAREFLERIQSDISVSMTDVLDALCADHKIHVVQWTQTGVNEPTRTGGGSYASSKVVTRFRKEARDPGRRKLRDEIRFLENMPDALRPLYPEVLRSGETDELVFMEQEFLPFSTLRHHLFTGRSPADRAVARIETILTRLYELAYAPHTRPAPADYLEQYHFQRLWHRLRYTFERAPVFNALLTARRIWINGRAYHNVPQLLSAFERSEQACSLVTPGLVSPYLHGDLHFENIMIDPEGSDFRLIDPRGYEYCDLYYDLGKISHSTNGKYDFIHEGRFELSWKAGEADVEAEYRITPSPIRDLYDQIDKAMRPLYRTITGESLAEERTLFAEAMHFCTMMPFHLGYDGREDKAVAIYLTGTILFNEACERFGLEVRDNGAPLGPQSWGRRTWRNVG